jgi:valyl-tRNA synthetase
VAESLRVLTSPVRVTGGLRLAQLVALVSADAVVRYLRGDGNDVDWLAPVLTGDLTNQYAVEQELIREGLDRDSVDRAAFVSRVNDADTADRTRAAELLAALDVGIDLDALALDDERVVTAARTAFARLYEAGSLVREERVVKSCPRCMTVIDAVDAEAGTAPAQQLTLAVATADDVPIDIDLVATELLAGAAAVAVPAGHPAEGGSVDLPLADRTVPVLVDADATTARLVIPAHDAADLELARAGGLAMVRVLDSTGTVTGDGPFAGLGRFAARGAASELLLADGVVQPAGEVEEAVDRCRRCGTILVPHLGNHWFLPMTDLEVSVADHVRQDALTVAPIAARDALVAAAGGTGDWCVSHQVLGGQPVPVATCLDCGRAAVGVEVGESCGHCMGTLAPDEDVLDARFVAAVWPLAAAGWPARERGPVETAASTMLTVGPTGLVSWALRMSALGLRVADTIPFSHIAVHAEVDAAWQLEPVADALAASLGEDRRAARTGLVAGRLDHDEATASATAPPSDVGALTDEVDAAMRAGTPAAAVSILNIIGAANDVLRAAAAAIAAD